MNTSRKSILFVVGIASFIGCGSGTEKVPEEGGETPQPTAVAPKKGPEMDLGDANALRADRLFAGAKTAEEKGGIGESVQALTLTSTATKGTCANGGLTTTGCANQIAAFALNELRNPTQIEQMTVYGSGPSTSAMFLVTGTLWVWINKYHYAPDDLVIDFYGYDWTTNGWRLMRQSSWHPTVAAWRYDNIYTSQFDALGLSAAQTSKVLVGHLEGALDHRLNDPVAMYFAASGGGGSGGGGGGSGSSGGGGGGGSSSMVMGTSGAEGANGGGGLRDSYAEQACKYVAKIAAAVSGAVVGAAVSAATAKATGNGLAGAAAGAVYNGMVSEAVENTLSQACPTSM